MKPDVISWPAVGDTRRRVTYCYQPGLHGGLVLHFRTENAQLVAIMNDGYVQHMRVGALAALGARYLARDDASTVGILGSGGMARSFAMGFAAVRPIKIIRAYSPTAAHRRAYCAAMSSKLGVAVIPMESPEGAVRGAHIVATCTNAMDPVLPGKWLEPGMHVAPVTRRELGTDALARITVVGQLLDRAPLEVDRFADDNFEPRMNVMAYVAGQPEERGRLPVVAARASSGPRVAVVPCVDWATEKPAARHSKADVTILAELSGGITSDLASGGIQGLQFAAVAGRACELAAARGLGKALPAEWFLQDVPT